MRLSTASPREPVPEAVSPRESSPVTVIDPVTAAESAKAGDDGVAEPVRRRGARRGRAAPAPAEPNADAASEARRGRTACAGAYGRARCDGASRGSPLRSDGRAAPRADGRADGGAPAEPARAACG